MIPSKVSFFKIYCLKKIKSQFQKNNSQYIYLNRRKTRKILLDGAMVKTNAPKPNCSKLYNFSDQNNDFNAKNLVVIFEDSATNSCNPHNLPPGQTTDSRENQNTFTQFNDCSAICYGSRVVSCVFYFSFS